LGFGASGGGALPNHEHTNIALDGGPLDFNNTTIASLVAGSTTFSDGAALQELVIGNPADSLIVNAGGTAPEWAAGSASVATAFFSFADSDFWGSSSTYWGALSGVSEYPAWSYSESLHTTPVNTDLTFTRFQINIGGNGKGSNQIAAFRDDGSNVAPVTITASTTGTFDSGAVSVNIAAGSLINWAYHATTGGTVQFYASLGTVTT